MNKCFIFLFMIFCHVTNDFFQGYLANLKQKEYWEKEAPDAMYKYDYIMALIMHSLSWTFSIMFPIFLYYNFKFNSSDNMLLILIFIMNTILHAIVDHEKANVRSINLIVDQLIHICQIIITFILFIIL